MRKIFILSISMCCMLFVQSLQAASWTRTTIKDIQLSSTRVSLYVRVNDPINFPGCEETNSLYFLNNDTITNFDQIFSMLMLAKAQDTEISILITGKEGNGKCSSNLTVVQEPLIRFH